MEWLRWWRGRRDDGGNGALKQWRNDWETASASFDAGQAAPLRARLEALGLPEEEIEIEREMLEGLERVGELAAELGSGGLPTIVTGHRAVGADLCHFSAPVSMPEDPAQPSGRLILTSTRAIFLGGARGVTLPWHAAAEPRHAGRDLLLLRADRTALHRFRCNSFADALTAAFLARHLAGRARTRDGARV